MGFARTDTRCLRRARYMVNQLGKGWAATRAALVGEGFTDEQAVRALARLMAEQQVREGDGS